MVLKGNRRPIRGRLYGGRIGVLALTFVFVAMLFSHVSAGASAANRVSLRATPQLIGAAGGRVTLRVTVHSATLQDCAFGSKPHIPGFTATVNCSNRTVIRSGVVGRNHGPARTIYLFVGLSSLGGHDVVVHQAGEASTTTTTSTTSTTSTTTTTTIPDNLVIENFSGNFTYSEVGFTTTQSETLNWSWTNGNGDYSTGFLLYNAWTSTDLVSYEVVPPNTPSGVTGGNGSITIPAGTYDLDIECIGPWLITIS